MRKVLAAAIALFSSIPSLSQAAKQNIFLCRDVRSIYFSDTVLARSMVINYNYRTGEVVFLRCGLSNDPRQAALQDRPQELLCGIYRRATVQGLCQDEVNFKRMRRIPTELVEVGTKHVISGGTSVLGAASRAYSYGRSEWKPTCEGTQLIAAMINGSEVSARQNQFISAQMKLKPFYEWVQILNMVNMSPIALDEGYVFSRMDAFINPLMGNGIRLENNLAYLKARRDRHYTDHIDFNNSATGALCRVMGTTQY